MKFDYQIIDAIPASIYWKDLKGAYLGCNQYMLNMIGAASRDEVIGKTDYELIWGDQADPLREYDLKVINSNKTINQEETATLDGVTKIYLSSKSPLYDEKGNIIGIIGASTNITEQKRLQAQTAHLEKILNSQIIDAVPASIYWKDPNGVYLGCNKYMLDMVGLTSKEAIIGKTDYALSWKKQANKLRENDEYVLTRNKILEYEEELLLANGQIQIYLSSKSPLYDKENNIIGIVGVSINIIEFKKLQDTFTETEKNLVEALKIKERFLRNISHEVRNPMQAFTATAETLVEKWERFNDSQRFQMAELINDSGKRLASLVSNTFELSNLLGNKVQLELKKYDLSDVILNIVDKYNNSSKGSKEIIKFNINKKHILTFDKEKVEKVIDNLLMNSLKWSPKNKLVTVELHETYLNNSSVPAIQCCIKDQGIGIPNEELNFIFQPFTESSKTATQTGGIGLGLALCKEIINAHAGEIWAENNLNAGATFNFIIPCTLVSNID